MLLVGTKLMSTSAKITINYIGTVSITKKRENISKLKPKDYSHGVTVNGYNA